MENKKPIEEVTEDIIQLSKAYISRKGVYDEDLLQEILASVCQHYPKFDPNISKLSTFVYMIAETTYMNLEKKKNRQRRKNKGDVSYDSIVSLADNDLTLDTLRQTGIFPADYEKILTTIDEEVAFNVQYEHILKRLKTERDRDIINLKLQGYSEREIGEKYGVSSHAINNCVKKIYRHMIRNNLI